MYSISRRQPPAFEDDLFCTLHRPIVDRKHLVDNTEKRIERRLNCLTTIDGNVAMQNLLENLSIRHEPLPITDELLQKSLGVSLVGMG